MRPEHPDVHEKRDSTEDQEADAEQHKRDYHQSQIPLAPGSICSDPEADPHEGVRRVETLFVPVEVL